MIQADFVGIQDAAPITTEEPRERWSDREWWSNQNLDRQYNRHDRLYGLKKSNTFVYISLMDPIPGM